MGRPKTRKETKPVKPNILLAWESNPDLAYTFLDHFPLGMHVLNHCTSKEFRHQITIRYELYYFKWSRVPRHSSSGRSTVFVGFFRVRLRVV